LTTDTLIWTVGSGGLIGSAINQRSGNPFTATPINWSHPVRSITDLTTNLDNFTLQSAAYSSWAIIWAGGSATTASSPEQAQAELHVFTEFTSYLTQQQHTSRGSFFLISSAGGVYAGSSDPPFTEETIPQPLGTYGNLKLDQENQATKALATNPNINLTICRVSNAYGPGQDLNKLQGLISRLAVSTLKREPLNLFVPLSTVRDFIFTTDISHRVHELVKQPDEQARIRIIASEQPTSLGYLLKVCQGVFHRKIPIAMGTHPSSSAQAPNLRFRSLYKDSRPQIELTQLPIGVKAVFNDIAMRLAQQK